MASWFVAMALALAGSVLPGGEPAQPVKIIETQIAYELTGSDIKELRRQLVYRQRERLESGGHGYTQSRVEAHYGFEQGAGSCRLVDAEVVLRIATTLPEWKPRRNPSRALRKQWAAMYSALAAHEATHARNAREAADEVRIALAALPASGRCSDLEWAAQRCLKRAVFRLRMRDGRFDRRTRHGALEGVTL